MSACRSRPTIQNARPSPSAAPIPPRSNDSTTSWRTTRPRLAPSAARSAISRARPVACASNRLTRLTAAMRSRHPTAPIRIHSARRVVSLASHSLDGWVTMSNPLLTSGKRSRSTRATRERSACACAGVTPARSRPIADTSRLSRSSFAVRTSGTNTSPASSNGVPCGSTPTMMNGFPSSVIDLPNNARAPEASLPELVREDHHSVVVAGLIFAAHEDAPFDRGDAERTQEPHRHLRRHQPLRRLTPGEVQAGKGDAADLREAAGEIGNVPEICVGERRLLPTRILPRAPDLHEAIRLRKRHRHDQDRIDHAEHRSAGADAERERQNGERREQRALAQRAGAVPEVLPDVQQQGATKRAKHWRRRRRPRHGLQTLSNRRLLQVPQDARGRVVGRHALSARSAA